MPCYFPLTAYYAADYSGTPVSKGQGPTKRRALVFDVRQSHSGVPVKLPCGYCIGCRLERSRQWAVRCMHEKRVSTSSCFVTLTYDNKSLPEGGTLVKRDMQLFMKRLRKERGDGIRFFGCGEYGGITARPHYHVLLFNVDFPDMRSIGRSGRDEPIYRSASLERVWTSGNNVIGDVTFSSACYVARYICDKMTPGSPKADAKYGRVDADGVCFQVAPEFALMSRKPGIGMKWFQKYSESDLIPHDSVIMDAKEAKPPRFYDTMLPAHEAAVIKKYRRLRAMENRADNTHARRRVKEELVLRNIDAVRKGEL